MPRRRTARHLGWAPAVAVLLLCAACTDAPPGSAPSGRLPEGIGMRVFQTRFDYAERVLEISVSNDGPSDFTLVSASFASAQFTDAARFTDRLTLAPGMTRNLRVHLAQAVCAGEPTAAGTVTLRWTPDGGGTASASVTLRDDTGTLERIVREDCLVAAVDAVVSIGPPERLRLEGAAAWLDLTLAPTGKAGAVTIDRIGHTTLLAPAHGTDWPVGLRIDSAASPRTISLELRPARCDPHAVAEDKRGTVFPLAVSPEDGPAGTYNLAVGDAVRREIYAWVSARCAG